MDFEKLGAFYLGKEHSLADRNLLDRLVMYDSRDLTTHAICIGMTGSGKTGLCVDLLEDRVELGSGGRHAAPASADAGAGGADRLKKRRGHNEGGFAMLLVFVMAASIAIMLYLELPRFVFEAQRQKESLLIERGEQYQRAIQLYVRKKKKYPQTVEELEETNSIPYLRRRYPDPMTGKDDWRLVHVDGAGVLTDSLVQKPKEQGKDGQQQASVNTFTSEGPAFGSTQIQSQAEISD